MFSLNDGLLLDQLDDPNLWAVIEDGRLVDLWTEDNNHPRLGSVHLVRITGRFDQHKRLTGQLAGGRALSWTAKKRITQKEGQLALVTLTAASREGKPIQAVAGIELAGQYVTLRWQGMDKSQVQESKKLRPSAHLDLQLQKITEACEGAGLLDSGFTLVLRRSAFTSDGMNLSAPCKAITAEAAQMIEHWQRYANMPEDLRAETQARSVYAGLSFADKLRQIKGKKEISLLTQQDWYMLCEQVEEAGRSEIITKDGVVLYIEQTRAAFMIDIDSAASKLAPRPFICGCFTGLFAAMSACRKNSCGYAEINKNPAHRYFASGR